MSTDLKYTSSNQGLTVTAFRGDNSVLLTFDIDSQKINNLAGFAILCTPPKGAPSWVANKLKFDSTIHSETTSKELKDSTTPSHLAPIQKFRWIHYPTEIIPGMYTYDVTAMYFDGKGGLTKGPSTKISFPFLPKLTFDSMQVGFTRCYLSSMAYSELFDNAPIRPLPPTVNYETAKYSKQYTFLGGRAREILFNFMNEALQDKTISIDALIFDIDEPDFVNWLEKMGDRVRVFFDNCSEHTDNNALEPSIWKRIENSAGKTNVKYGHFKRFAHCKVLIKKKNGKAISVFTGSMNFSVRGLYVQANNVIRIDNPVYAEYWEKAFEQTWNDPAGFKNSEIAKNWKQLDASLEVCFSPHSDANISLKAPTDAVQNAHSSVLFSVMELGGGGSLLQQLKSLANNRPDLFSYGVTQSMGADETQIGVTVHGPSHPTGTLVPFTYLHGKVPPPFDQEISGGPGIVIHNKFVVIDFNGPNPCVFTGSSNFAAGGETSNGDNLLCIKEPNIATLYAIEAIRLIDHFYFRASMKKATRITPLTLSKTDSWVRPYYDKNTLKYKERVLFSS